MRHTRTMIRIRSSNRELSRDKIIIKIPIRNRKKSKTMNKWQDNDLCYHILAYMISKATWPRARWVRLKTKVKKWWESRCQLCWPKFLWGSKINKVTFQLQNKPLLHKYPHFLRLCLKTNLTTSPYNRRWDRSRQRRSCQNSQVILHQMHRWRKLQSRWKTRLTMTPTSVQTRRTCPL